MNVAQPLPTGIEIPDIGTESSLVPLGLQEDGSLAVPPVDQPLQAGYYAGRLPDVPGDEVLPGENGPAVVAGHVDGVIDGRKGQPGVFYRLRELVVNADVVIYREDGSQLRFKVYDTQRFNKDEFPSKLVYGPTTRPELRLITCGGEFDRTARSYTDNIVVFAVLID